MKIPAAKIYFSDKDKKEILNRIEACLSSGQLTLGQNGKEFEKLFAQYTGVQYAVAVNSGTSAAEIPMRSLNIKDKEIIVPTNTFFATPASVLHAGGKVKFVDIDPETFSINVEDLKQKITKDTAGVVVVHIAGIITPRISEIQKICEDRGIFLFEDAAHAHGSSFEGKMAGAFGIAAAFSFYPTKIMTSAEGGMIVTSSQKIQEEAMLYRDQGKASFTTNIHNKLGYNWRMSEPHAIIGLTHLKRLDEFIEGRRGIAKIYDEGLSDIPNLLHLQLPNGCKSNYYKYIALLDRDIDRQKVKDKLKKSYGVSLSGEVYQLPCHLQPIFSQGYQEGDFPLAEDVCQRHICLPIYAEMTVEEAQYVLSSLKTVLS